MSERKLRIAIAVTSAIGIAISAYLTYIHYAEISPICTVGGSCEKVQSSSYAMVIGLPVAVVGLGGDILILLSALLRTQIARYAGFMLALIGFGFTIYLTYLELFVIHAICQWCVAHAVVITALLVLTAIRFFKEPQA